MTRSPLLPGRSRSASGPTASSWPLPAATLSLRSATALTLGDDGPLFDDGLGRSTSVSRCAPSPPRARRRGHRRPPEVAQTSRITHAREGRAGAGPGRLLVAGGHRPARGLRPAGRAAGGEPALAGPGRPRALPLTARARAVHGGAWGTRDVTQGPLELLLALDRQSDARALLLRIFAAQSADGTWPQAFGFLPGDEHFRMEPSHGDVVHWPVLAVGRYLLASGDATLLGESVPWYTPADGAPVPATTMRSHVERALGAARAHFLPGTTLVAYGHGDWNDSLQPADPTMAATMTSAWTVTLHHQSLRTLADGLESVGGEDVLVDALRTEASATADDLRRYLLVDGELAGYAQLDPPDRDGGVGVRRLLVHPRDEETGLRHGSLQMIHALGDDLFARDEAAHHVALVREHLMGVDGVRLFDRPPPYSGGLMHHFQRAETATFVGREIGLMYVHAHLRWCEAMARSATPTPCGWGSCSCCRPPRSTVVPGARRRQANAYPSSSDVACLDRGTSPHGTPRCSPARRASKGAGGSTPPARGCCCGSSCTRCWGSAVAPDGRDRPRPAVAAGRAHGHVPLAGGCCGCATAWATAATVRPASASADGARRPRAANPYRPGGLVLDLADLAPALRPAATSSRSSCRRRPDRTDGPAMTTDR